MPSQPTLELSPHRLLPADPGVRRIGEGRYAAVRDLPIISPHGHVPAEWLALDTPSSDSTSLLITPDHYVTRLLHAHGLSLSAPDAIRRHRAAVTETAGFAKTSGFIDDTRALCSIPAQRDLPRRLDAGFVAQLVAEHRPADEEALEVINDLVIANPRKAFRL